MYLNKAKRIEREFNKQVLIAEYNVFRGCCAFFKMNLESIYFHLALKTRIKDYYCSLNSFTIACTQRPQSMMAHDDVRKAVLNLSSKLKDDVFKAMNDSMAYEDLRKKWSI